MITYVVRHPHLWQLVFQEKKQNLVCLWWIYPTDESLKKLCQTLEEYPVKWIKKVERRTTHIETMPLYQLVYPHRFPFFGQFLFMQQRAISETSVVGPVSHVHHLFSRLILKLIFLLCFLFWNCSFVFFFINIFQNTGTYFFRLININQRICYLASEEVSEWS